MDFGLSRPNRRKLTAMLSLLGSIYEKIVDVRNYLYDKGVFDTFDLGARTISIGNITAGGTGKTPLVAFVASLLAERGEKVCILTRGYGREDAANRVLVSNGTNVLAGVRESGDEPFELANKLLGKAIVIADADRVAAAEWAKRRFGVTVFLLDDGLQHRKAKRDVDIVCIDATNPFGGGKMLPAGRLREPLHNLSRADIVVITRADLVSTQTISNLRSEISNWNSSAPIFEISNSLMGFRELHSTDLSTTILTGKNVYAFCALGNPESFFKMLTNAGLDIREDWAVEDHYLFSQLDVDLIESDAQGHLCEALVVTAKDAVKLEGLNFETPCYVAEIEIKIDDDITFGKLL